MYLRKKLYICQTKSNQMETLNAAQEKRILALLSNGSLVLDHSGYDLELDRCIQKKYGSASVDFLFEKWDSEHIVIGGVAVSNLSYYNDRFCDGWSSPDESNYGVELDEITDVTTYIDDMDYLPTEKVISEIKKIIKYGFDCAHS